MIVIYDGTFEGFLSVVFDCYDLKLEPKEIGPKNCFQQNLLEQQLYVETDGTKSERVWKALQKKMSSQLDQLPYLAFLSKLPGIEMHLLRFIRMAFASKEPVYGNFSDQDVLAIRKASRLVTREAMRLMQFVRFQKTLDGIYFSAMSPDYDVLPMVLKHFKERFTDQQWILYDLKRDYGFFYNLKDMEEITLTEKVFNVYDGSLPSDVVQEGEAYYQSLWKSYCTNITIRERLNHKVHKQHMPKRYWKYLAEKH
jgi:probable DNA metabolism protein